MMRKNIISALIHEIKINRRILRQFAWIMAVMLGIVIPAIIAWFNDWQIVRAALIVGSVGAVFLAAGIIAPQWLRPVYIVWMLIALMLGAIVTRIIIAIVFYLLITPIGWVRRTFSKNDLPGFRPDFRKKTYWIKRDKGKLSGQMKKQY